MIATRFAVVAVLTLAAVLGNAVQSQAQGTVAWATGHPAVGQTGTPPTSHVDVKGTYTDIHPWFTRAASVLFVPPGGGTSYSIALDISNGNSGRLLMGAIVAKRITIVPAGTYNIYISHSYENRINPYQTQSILSSTVSVTIP